MTDQPPRIRVAPTPLQSWPVLVFILGCIGLDLQYFGLNVVNIGNFALVGGAGLAIMLLVFFRDPRLRLRLTFIDMVYGGYLALIAYSATWSPVAGATLFQFVLLSIAWLGTIFLGGQHILSVVRYLIISAVVVAVLSLLIVPIMPGFAFQPHSSSGIPELRGIFNHQLRLGLFMALACGLIGIAALNKDLPRIFSKRWMAPTAFGIVFVVMIFAAARLYTVAVILALVLTFGLSQRGWPRYVCLAIIALGLYLILSDQSTLLGQLEDQGVDTSLTGRTTLWEKTLRVANQKPGWGYGFASFDSQAFDWMWYRYRPPHPHNSFIQAYFETGVIGLSVILFMVAVHLQQAIYYAGRERRYSYTLFVVALTVLGSLTGANYAAKPSSLLTIALLMLAIEVRRGRNFNREAARRRTPNAQRRRSGGAPKPEGGAAG